MRADASGRQVAVWQLGQPALHAGRGRLDLPALGHHDKTRLIRPLRLRGLSEQQCSTGTVGELRRHRADKGQLGFIGELPAPRGRRRRREV